MLVNNTTKHIKAKSTITSNNEKQFYFANFETSSNNILIGSNIQLVNVLIEVVSFIYIHIKNTFCGELEMIL